MDRIIIGLIAIGWFGLILAVCLDNHLREHFGGGCMDLVPFSRIKKYPVKRNCIFVSIASYRDRECKKTIHSLFENAVSPLSVFVGVCEQNKIKKEGCGCCPQYDSQIRFKHLNYTEAKGPTFARYWCSLLWQGEELYLQIDSHMKFVPEWDVKCFKMMRQASQKNGNPKVVISAYPPTPNQMKLKGAPAMCNAKYNQSLPSFAASWAPAAEAPVPSPRPFVAAGLMLLPGTFLYSVPFDPYLPHLFQGEELLLSARLWTHGYDMYTPNQKICSHDYGRKGEPKFWDDHKEAECRANAVKRAKIILGIVLKTSILPDFLIDTNLYGLGSDRTIEAFWKKAEIDPVSKKATSSCHELYKKK